ncbi:SMC5-SMC6 complex localization factor protein 1 [Rhinophrynus dorsalis]
MEEISRKRIVQLTGFRDVDKEELIEPLFKLDCIFIDSEKFENCTHLIAKKPSRSEKWLAACASGKWVLTKDYIINSAESGRWLDETTYEWGYKIERDTHYSPQMQSAPKRWREYLTCTGSPGAFWKWKVALLVNQGHKQMEPIVRVLKAGHAILCNPGNCDEEATHVFLDTACFHIEQEKKVCDAPYYSVQYIGTYLLEARHHHHHNCINKSIVFYDKDKNETHQVNQTVPSALRTYSKPKPQWKPKMKSSEIGRVSLNRIEELIEGHFFIEALGELEHLFPSLPPVHFLQSLLKYLLQGNINITCLGRFFDIFCNLLQYHPPWESSYMLQYYLDFLQCPLCRKGTWSFIEVLVRSFLNDNFCLCHKPSDLEMEIDKWREVVASILKFVAKVMQEEAKALSIRVCESTDGLHRAILPSLITGIFWSDRKAMKILTNQLSTLTDLVLRSYKETCHTDNGVEKRRLFNGSIQTLLDMEVLEQVPNWGKWFRFPLQPVCDFQEGQQLSSDFGPPESQLLMPSGGCFVLHQTLPFHKADSLFVIPEGPNAGQASSKFTFVSWIKDSVCQTCGIGKKLVSFKITADSTRSVDAYWAWKNQASAEQLYKAATWYSLHTFTIHYCINDLAFLRPAMAGNRFCLSVNEEVFSQEVSCCLSVMLGSAVEYWILLGFYLDKNLIHQVANDLAFYICVPCEDFSLEEKENFILSITSPWLQMFVTEVIFKSFCLKNNINISSEPLSLEKLFCSYIPALWRVRTCGNEKVLKRKRKIGQRPCLESQKALLMLNGENQNQDEVLFDLPLTTAPQVFQRVLGALIAVLHRDGVRVTPYMDDLLLKASSAQILHQQIQTCSQTLSRHEWVVNLDKSDLIPSQRILFLGIIFDTVRSKVFLPEDVAYQIANRVSEILNIDVDLFGREINLHNTGGSLCHGTHQGASESHPEAESGAVSRCPDHAGLASSVLVSRTDGYVCGGSVTTTLPSGSASTGLSVERRRPTFPFDDLVVESSILKRKGYSSAVVSTMMSARKPVSSKIYHRERIAVLPDVKVFLQGVAHVRPTFRSSAPQVLRKLSRKSEGGSFYSKENLPSPGRGLLYVRQNTKGETALHTACRNNKVKKLSLLLSLPGTDINAKDNAGWTPLHEACNHGSTECVREILQRCPDVDLLSHVDGVTPLHDALLNGHVEIAKMLLQYGGPLILQHKDSFGKFPLDYIASPQLKKELFNVVQLNETIEDFHKQAALEHDNQNIEFAAFLLSRMLLNFHSLYGLPSNSQSAKTFCPKATTLNDYIHSKRETTSFTHSFVVRCIENIVTMQKLSNFTQTIPDTLTHTNGLHLQILLTVIHTMISP